jgi:hypothetical protein
MKARSIREQYDERVEKERLKDEVNHIEQEGRLVVPGIQALFGFQLIAVFSDRFTELSNEEQLLHWFGVLMTALSILLALSPAAFHRQAEPGSISGRFVRLASRWLALSLVPLMIGICVDFFWYLRHVRRRES